MIRRIISICGVLIVALVVTIWAQTITSNAGERILQTSSPSVRGDLSQKREVLAHQSTMQNAQVTEARLLKQHDSDRKEISNLRNRIIDDGVKIAWLSTSPKIISLPPKPPAGIQHSSSRFWRITCLTVTAALCGCVFWMVVFWRKLKQVQASMQGLQEQHSALVSAHKRLEEDYRIVWNERDEALKELNQLQRDYNGLELVLWNGSVDLAPSFAGRIWSFEETTQRTVRCNISKCNADRIPADNESMLQHLNSHVEIRVVETDLSKIEALLANN